MNNLIVCKFGGSSARLQDKIHKIVHDNPMRRIVVMSTLKDVTNSLIKLAETGRREYFDFVVNEHLKHFSGERYSELHQAMSAELGQRMEAKMPKAEFFDYIKAMGEHWTAQATAITLNAQYVNPMELFLLSNDFGKARILPESRVLIKNHFQDILGVFVVAGFFGKTKNNKIATSNRGGSDLWQTYLASTLRAYLAENFTDKRGICAAPPDLISGLEEYILDEITYQEQRDLSYIGSKIIQEEAVLEARHTPILVRSTMEYPATGTYIVDERISDPKKPIAGIAYKGNFCSFNLSMDTLPLNRILEIFANHDASIEFMPMIKDNVSVIVRKEEIDGKLDELIADLRKASADVQYTEGLGSLAIAGKGIKNRIGIAADIFTTLSDERIDIKYICQGVQERCMIIGISEDEGPRAVRKLYQKFILDRSYNPGIYQEKRLNVRIEVQDDLGAFYIQGPGLNEIKGILKRSIEQMGDIPVYNSPAAIDDFSLVVPQSRLRERQVIGQLKSKLEEELREDVNVSFKENLSRLVVYNDEFEGMAANVHQKLAKAGVNLVFISRGTADKTTIYGIESKDKDRALMALGY